LQGAITNILEENVVQPLLVSISAITLASETVRSILKIDDIVSNDLRTANSMNSIKQIINNFYIYFRLILEGIKCFYVLISPVSNHLDGKLIIIIVSRINSCFQIQRKTAHIIIQLTS